MERRGQRALVSPLLLSAEASQRLEAGFPPHQTGGEKAVGKWGPKRQGSCGPAGGLLAVLGNQGRAGDSSMARGAEVKGSRDLYLLGAPDSWVPAHSAAGSLGNPGPTVPSQLFLSLSPRKHAGFFELDGTGDHSLGEEHENDISFSQTVQGVRANFLTLI